MFLRLETNSQKQRSQDALRRPRRPPDLGARVGAVSFLAVGVGSAFFLPAALVSVFTSGVVRVTSGAVGSELMASTPNPAALKH